MKFVYGNTYTRMNISAVIGGEPQSYMPRVAGSIVGICVTPEDNPNPPKVILVGKSNDVQERAEQFAKQTEALPVFVKLDQAKWIYMGLWALEMATADPAVIAREAAFVNRKDVVQVLYLKQIGK